MAALQNERLPARSRALAGTALGASANVPYGLRIARRTLEELDGVRIVSDWTADTPRVWRLELDLTPADLGTTFEVPKTSRWFVRAPENYPLGLIDVLPAVIGGLSGIFPHQSPFVTRPDAPYRGAKICVATDSEGNLRLDTEAEPRTAEDRLAWHIYRALGWIEKASRGTLLAPGDPFELPVYRGADSGLVAFRDGPEDLVRWAGINATIGVADLRRLDIQGDAIWIVASFRSLDGTLLFEPAWGIRLTSKQVESRTALWLRVPELVVLPPYAAPSTWQEVSAALGEQGVKLFAELRRGTERLHDGACHPLLIGFPVPERVGDAAHQMHWLAVDLAVLERSVPNGFRPNEVGFWVASLRGTFRPDAEVHWAASQNWHPNELATRGRLGADLMTARVLLIGGGALGSPVAELLVRAGVTHLTVVDGQRLEVGNLVRHTLTMDELGQSKAEALARRLNAASPNARVVARPTKAETLVDTPFLRDFELVIETTGDHRILELLGRVEAPHAITYASLAITLHARQLIAYLSRGTRFPVDAFDAAYEPVGRAERERGEERPMEGIGCWHPVFPARADQVWLMASAAVGLLNDAWPVADGAAAMHRFERAMDQQGRFTGVVSKVEQ
jgi:hypothetical protein